MASSVRSRRFALRPSPDHQPPYGIWWPHTRSLADQLAHLVDAWPAGNRKISRILYSPPDWDDHPHSVLVAGRRMKTGSFPRDDTHRVTLVFADGSRSSITVIPPETSHRDAQALLADDDDAGRPSWENEGGQLRATG